MNKIILLFTCALLTIPAFAKVSVPRQDYAKAWASYSKQTNHTVPAQKYPYQHCFETSAKKHHLPVALLLSIARGESDFNPNARSSANAYGLMQILWPATAKELGINTISDLKKPCLNVDAGARYLSHLLNLFDGDIHLALAAYNYGPSRIKANKNSIPKGANWYSGYIYQHLQYVLAKGEAASKRSTLNYRDENKLNIMVFYKPYRALAFIEAINKRAPDVRLNMFDSGLGRFHIKLLYRNQTELKQAKTALEKAGIMI